MGVNSRHRPIGGIGVQNISSVQVTVTGTATQLIGNRDERAGLLVTQMSASPGVLYLGGDNTVTSSTGQPVAPTQWTPISLSYTGPLWAVTAGGTQLVCVTELW